MKQFPAQSYWIRSLALCALLTLGCGAVALAQLQFFNYQGHYSDSGVPSNGNLNFRFRLFDAETDGNPVGSPVYLNGVTVVDGTFDVDLPLANVFQGESLWLEIRVEDLVLPTRNEVMPPN